MIRPMRVDDTPAVQELTFVAFEALGRARGLPAEPRPDPAAVRPRFENLIRSDPDGVFVAERDGELTGAAISIRREDVWGLSLLVVHPAHQSGGIGRELLAHAHGYADGARGRIVLSSQDPRALRAYSRLGLTGHPSWMATGTPRDVAEPPGIRTGTEADLPFVDAVGRHVRGAAHGDDIRTLLEMGAELLIADERGFAVTRNGALRLLAGLDEAGAQDMLRGVLARAPGSVAVEFLTARQAWAVPVCLDAELELQVETGAVFLGGDTGPFSPYLPNGAFL